MLQDVLFTKGSKVQKSCYMPGRQGGEWAKLFSSIKKQTKVQSPPSKKQNPQNGPKSHDQVKQGILGKSKKIEKSRKQARSKHVNQKN